MPRRRKTRRKKRSTKVLNKTRITQKDAFKINVLKLGRQLDTFNYTFVRMDSRTLGITVPRTATATGLSEGYEFALEHVQLNEEFESLFDQFRILKVHLTFNARLQQVSQLAGSTQENKFKIPRIYMIRDYDDKAGLTYSAVKQRSNVIQRQCTESFTITTVPQVAKQFFETGVSFSYGQPMEQVWIDCGKEDTEHYGLKYYVEGSNNADTGTGPEFGYDIDVRYVLQFRQVR